MSLLGCRWPGLLPLYYGGYAWPRFTDTSSRSLPYDRNPAHSLSVLSTSTTTPPSPDAYFIFAGTTVQSLLLFFQTLCPLCPVARAAFLQHGTVEEVQRSQATPLGLLGLRDTPPAPVSTLDRTCYIFKPSKPSLLPYHHEPLHYRCRNTIFFLSLSLSIM